jgi:hypothetical protein
MKATRKKATTIDPKYSLARKVRKKKEDSDPERAYADGLWVLVQSMLKRAPSNIAVTVLRNAHEHLSFYLNITSEKKKS